MASYYLVLLGSLLSGLLSILTIILYIRFHVPNLCHMTYMYQVPEFIKINFNHTVRNKFPKYRLYVYGEGDYAESLMHNEFQGFPVIFIPGNAGSYKQVRSFASVALMRSAVEETPFLFNFFTIDFDEELSALYGPYLHKQTEFATLCAHRILGLYRKHNPELRRNLKITLIGHSMGGLLVRHLLHSGEFEKNLFSAVFTLATPNLKPAISIDRSILKYYNDLDNLEVKSTTIDVPEISISGGLNDIQVRSDVTNFPKPTPSHIAVNSYALTHVWATADHLCIVWCNQLVRLVIRSIFDLHDEKSNLEKSIDIVRYHFVINDGGKSFFGFKPNMMHWAKKNLNDVTSKEKSNIFELERKVYKVCLAGNGHVGLLYIRTNSRDICVFDQSVENSDCCKVDTKLLPGTNATSRYLKLENEQHCALIDGSNRFVVDNGQKIFVVLSSGPEKVDIVQVGNIFYWNWSKLYNANINAYVNLELDGFESVIQAFNLQLIAEPINASFSSCLDTVVQFHDGFDSRNDITGVFRYPYNSTDDLLVILQSNKPLNSTKSKLTLHLNPQCQYTLVVNSNFFVSLVQIIKYYFEKIPGLSCIQLTLLYITCSNVNVFSIFLLLMTLTSGFQTDCPWRDFIFCLIVHGSFTIIFVVNFTLSVLFQKLRNIPQRFRTFWVFLLVILLILGYAIWGMLTLVLLVHLYLLYKIKKSNPMLSNPTLRILALLGLNFWLIIFNMAPALARMKDFRYQMMPNFVGFDILLPASLAVSILIDKFMKNEINQAVSTCATFAFVVHVQNFVVNLYELNVALSIFVGLLVFIDRSTAKEKKDRIKTE